MLTILVSLRSILALTLTLMLVAISLPTYAQTNNCKLRFAAVNDIQWTVSNGGYDPDDATRYDRYNLSVQNTGNVTCDWYVTVTAGVRGDASFKRGAYNNSNFIEYYLLSMPNISPSFTVMDHPSVTREEQTISGTPIQPGASAQVDFFMGVESNQRLPEGDYIDTVTFKLITGAFDPYRVTLVDVQTVNVNIPVVPKLSLNIGTPTNGSHYQLDYGTLETGAQRNVDMWISSTSNFSLWVSSQNTGVLQHVQQPDQTIPYTLRYNGRTIRLNSSFPSYLSLLEDPTPWKNFLLNFEINNVSQNAKSGQYQDVLNVYVIDL